MAHYNVSNMHQAPKGNVFSIIEEYADMSPRAKAILSDQLFMEGHETFYKTVELMWPQSNHHDAIKLEKFLIILRKASRRLLH